MDLLHVVDRLEELVAGSQKMPIGGRAIVDRRRLFELIDQMRVAIPEEVHEAQRMVERRDELRREAEEEARMIVARAEEQAARLVDEHEVTLRAGARADEVAEQADQRLEARIVEANAEIQERVSSSRGVASQQMAAADEYADELLRRLERQLQAFVRSVQAGLEQIEAGPRRAGGPEAGAAAGDPDTDAPDARDAGDAPGDEVRPPLPLRPVDPATDGDDSAGGELTDLLHPRSGETAPGGPPEESKTAEDVIDDFTLPGLDDEPARRTEKAGDGEQRTEGGNQG